MRREKTNPKPFLLLTAIVAALPLLLSGDHLDGSEVSGTTSDLTGLYAFEGSDPDNLVLVANMQGFLPPDSATVKARFDEDVLIQFHIDNTGDLVENLIIQAIPRNDTMYFFGPAMPLQTGLESEVLTAAPVNLVPVSPGETEAEAITTTSEDGSMKFFAGPRDDPSFFDRNRFVELTNGNVTSFNENGADTFAERNVLSVVVELPKAMLGDGVLGLNPYHPDVPVYNVWVTTRRKL